VPTDAELLERTWAGMRHFFGTAARAPGATRLDFEGVTALVQPGTPERSLWNSVFYESPETLAAALGKLAAAYAAAGVNAWTVWVPDEDAPAARLLESAGHRLDAAPMAMGLELSEELAPDPGLDIDPAATLELVGRINDRAYGLENSFSRALRGLSDDALIFYVARLDGVPSACVPVLDTDGDCGIYGLATLPEAQGRGLGRGLMLHALAQAIARGCTSSTLQSTAAGYSLYRRLGYRDLGRIQMWERRERAR
jgi:ribosomal protein S18 acetylase RimI-like enzyme